jgi:hypothetical protein
VRLFGEEIHFLSSRHPCCFHRRFQAVRLHIREFVWHYWAATWWM